MRAPSPLVQPPKREYVPYPHLQRTIKAKQRKEQLAEQVLNTTLHSLHLVCAELVECNSAD